MGDMMGPGYRMGGMMTSRDDNICPDNIYCTTRCPSHDGKRCEILGCQPSHVCEPYAKALVAEVATLYKSRPESGLPEPDSQSTGNVWSARRADEGKWISGADEYMTRRAATNWTQEIAQTMPNAWTSSLFLMTMGTRNLVVIVQHAKSREAAIEAVLKAAEIAGFELPLEPKAKHD